MGIVQLDDVHVEFDGIHALNGLSLEIHEGEILSLMGPNGSGKTTTLRVIAGLLIPTRGHMLFRGSTITEENIMDLRKNATLVFQTPIHFGTSVFRNIAYGLRIRRVDEREIERRVMESLSMVGMSSAIDRPARKLSGGEQRRVALARAIALNTQILLLDEPTSDLDRESKNVIEQVLQEINRDRGTTIVVCTHNMFRARRFAHRIATIENGVIQDMGPAIRVFRHELDTLLRDENFANVFKGHAMALEGEEGIVQVTLDNNVMIQAVGDRTGEVTVTISPDDILVSKEQVQSSARNCLMGEILAIEGDQRTAALRVDVGIPMKVNITHASLRRLGISKGDRVCLTFKASSVVMY